MKYGWGTSILYDEEIIKDKNELYHSYNIRTYTGGTLFELANKQNKIDEYFNEIDRLGFNAVEISDGSTTIDSDRRAQLINKSTQQRIDLINTDIEAGSDMVIIEGRESGKNIGIYDDKGNVKKDDLTSIYENTPKEKVLWEAPQKNQQVELILTLSNDVNLGNINSNEIVSLETLRR